jgi:hypothetical protein
LAEVSDRVSKGLAKGKLGANGWSEVRYPNYWDI